MAVSAFKSATRRGGAATSSSSAGKEEPTEKKQAPLRRSRSVSAFSRSTEVSEFSNKRDNPLFCGGDSSPAEGNGVAAASKKLTTADGSWSKTELNRVGVAKPGGGSHGVGSLGEERRGRSASRNSGNPPELGRSVSRGRARSVSQRPVSRGHFVNSESEVEQESSPLKIYGNRTGVNMTRSSIESVDPGQARNLRTWSSRHPPVEPSSDSSGRSRLELPKLEDGSSAGSFSEVEEKTIKAVCEQMKSVQGHHIGEQTTTTSIYETVRSEIRRAISDIQNDLESAMRRSDSTATVGSNVIDIPSDLVKPSAVELVMDIRSEYAKKLEQSQERARKLRADLAVEEHRGEELSRILKEILPTPKASTSQKPRPARRASIERRKMSKRLTDEAMAYFDECVSLSTFDSSDFSSPEDPPLKLVRDTKPVVSGNDSVNHRINQSPEHPTLRMVEPHCPNSDPGSSSSTSVEGRKCQFSFSGRPSSYSNLQHDISKYIKNLEIDPKKDEHVPVSSRTSNDHELDGYHIQELVMQSHLFDKVMHKGRMESGGLLLCDGGVASVSFSPFGSFV